MAITFQRNLYNENRLSCLKMLVAFAVVVCMFIYPVTCADNDPVANEANTFAAIMNATADTSSTHYQQATDALRQISYGTEQFSLEFLKLLSKSVTPFNYDFIVSPFSIWSLLVLQAEGADGNTKQQLEQVLRLPSDLSFLRMSYKHIQKAMNINTSMVELATNQVLFSDQNRPVDVDYAYKLDQLYAADHISVDFHNSIDTYNKINRYVNQQTHGKIKKIVNMDDLREAQMIIVSAMFFKGQWKKPFNVSYTTEEPFYDEFDNFKGNVNMMFQRGAFSYTGIAELDSHVLEMPYGNDDRLSMIILLPRKKVLLTSVLERLASYGVGRVLTELRRADAEYDEDDIEVFLPRFSITADFTLNVILEQMGLTDIFDARKANLSKITQHPIYLSRIIHKATIDVNEVGTVAAAATGAIFANKAISPRFYANHPFAYLIVEKTTSTLLFCGQVRNPGKVEFKNL